MKDELLSPAQAAEYLHCSKGWLLAQIRRGKLHAYRYSAKFFRIRRGDLENFLHERSSLLSGGVEASHVGNVEDGLVPRRALSTVKPAACGSSAPPAQQTAEKITVYKRIAAVVAPKPKSAEQQLATYQDAGGRQPL